MRTFEELSKDERFWDELFYSTSNARHYEKNDTEKEMCNYELCRECGGKCCNRCGCHFSPDDFEDLSFEGLLTEIKKGYITLELVDGDAFLIHSIAWIVRMRNVDGPVIEGRVFGRKQAPCVMLGENGCRMNYENRPAGGRVLLPRAFSGRLLCQSKYGIERGMREWLYHQKVLHQLVDYIKDTDYPLKI